MKILPTEHAERRRQSTRTGVNPALILQLHCLFSASFCVFCGHTANDTLQALSDVSK